MELFFTNNIINDTALLDERESDHCIRVLRHKPGDNISFTDGAGCIYVGEIIRLERNLCKLKIISAREVADRGSYYLHVAVALTKSLDRYEWFLEKAVEFGVDRITPLVTDHSERRVFKRDRGERILLTALKQSLKTTMPVLDDLTHYEDFIKMDGVLCFNGEKAIGYCGEDEKRKLTTIITEAVPIELKKRLMILIGPEGDFSSEEVKLAKDVGFIPFTMGNSRFRVETAAVAAIAAVYFLGDM